MTDTVELHPDTHIKRRFCTSCQSDRQESNGEYRYFGKMKRWICQPCIQKKTVSIYRSNAKDKYLGPAPRR